MRTKASVEIASDGASGDTAGFSATRSRSTSPGPGASATACGVATLIVCFAWRGSSAMIVPLTSARTLASSPFTDSRNSFGTSLVRSVTSAPAAPTSGAREIVPPPGALAACSSNRVTPPLPAGAPGSVAPASPDAPSDASCRGSLNCWRAASVKRISETTRSSSTSVSRTVASSSRLTSASVPANSATTRQRWPVRTGGGRSRCICMRRASRSALAEASLGTCPPLARTASASSRNCASSNERNASGCGGGSCAIVRNQEPAWWNTNCNVVEPPLRSRAPICTVYRPRLRGASIGTSTSASAGYRP